MTSSSQPGGTGGPPLTPPYSALLLAGFTWHSMSPSNPVSSYLTLSPLPVGTGGLLSVALSLGLPPLVITQRPALWSPDFPPPVTAAIVWPAPANSCQVQTLSGLYLLHTDGVTRPAVPA